EYDLISARTRPEAGARNDRASGRPAPPVAGIERPAGSPVSRRDGFSGTLFSDPEDPLRRSIAGRDADCAGGEICIRTLPFRSAISGECNPARNFKASFGRKGDGIGPAGRESA